ncbi:MAG TPA: dTDP-4-dehydrorhamnose reductase [Spirochaetota bacterium]|nr:dTDP-4-dehydrorhamnose reductase [Spirochaetota bacterium]HPR49816.1 dTDP-4-dehydrorhamnose reductase [Spirochaetota bacterium]
MKKKKILIAGSGGQLGSEFVKRLGQGDYECLAPGEASFNITDHSGTKNIITELKPDIIINCAAYNAVDDAEDNAEAAFTVNRDAVINLAEISREKGISFVHYSSDYVFDGAKMDFYIEDDMPNPLGVYGKSKLEGEMAALEILKDCLVFRLSWVFGRGRQNFLFKLSQWAEKNRVLKVSADEVSVPTYTGHIVEATLAALHKGLTGLYHMTSSGYASRYELARYYLEKTGRDNLVIPVPMSSFPVKAKRPGFSAMSNMKLGGVPGISLPRWKEGVDALL